VRHLIFLNEEQRKANETLDLSLRKCEEELSRAKMSEKSWRDKYQRLLIAKTISTSEEDSKKTIARLSKLEREIEKCIALLNE
jgi:hypothetical protein